jgi:hypothetical protein
MMKIFRKNIRIYLCILVSKARKVVSWIFFGFYRTGQDSTE